ncbi:hypothetical protein MNBD_CPR01-562 [hydrothermal vent metagenome]|uniref:Type 4 fimbrial biogenesis protein PilX N-terminal domain-containing protein n=1 Tax=hydrothermal vent metagenome TaxID=652676 RepID=A0A3B0UQ34_9ZZZZ
MKDSIKKIRRHSAESGIALLITIVFVSVILSIGLTLGSLGYKQVLLASTENSSQKAFYSADSALECVLYADQQNMAFSTINGASGGSVSCGVNVFAFGAPTVSNGNGKQWYRYSIPDMKMNTNTCANVIVFKPKGAPGTTYLFSSGYDNGSCSASSRTTVRGIDMHYSDLN